MTSAPIKLSRDRFKAARKGEPYDPPATHADKLVAILTAAAERDPAPPSWAYREYIHANFSDKYIQLCPLAPIPARRP